MLLPSLVRDNLRYLSSKHISDVPERIHPSMHHASQPVVRQLRQKLPLKLPPVQSGVRQRRGDDSRQHPLSFQEYLPVYHYKVQKFPDSQSPYPFLAVWHGKGTQRAWLHGYNCYHGKRKKGYLLPR